MSSSSAPSSPPLTTLSQFILSSQPPSASGDLSLLLQAVQTACKQISATVRRVGLLQLTGLAGSANTSGDDMKKLDVISDKLFCDALAGCGRAGGGVSEEQEAFCSWAPGGKYVLAFDPLDGSSNIDCNVSIGSIFAIFQRLPGWEAAGAASPADVLQPGRAMTACGYCMYGSSTEMVINLGVGLGVHVFSLDPAVGEFFLTRRAVRIPDKPQRIYSINEGNAQTFSPGVKTFLGACKEGDKPYSLRYTGSMVADVHRTLLYGGVFLYPATTSAPAGKLRLLYEVNPMSRLFEEAGGRAICGVGQSPLDVAPGNIHQRAPIILGCKRDVDAVEALIAAEKAAA